MTLRQLVVSVNNNTRRGTCLLSNPRASQEQALTNEKWIIDRWIFFFLFFCGFRGENLRTRGTGGDQLLKGRSLNTSELTQLFPCASEWVMGSNRWLLIHITGVALFHTSTPPQLTRDSLLFFIFFKQRESALWKCSPHSLVMMLMPCESRVYFFFFFYKIYKEL